MGLVFLCDTHAGIAHVNHREAVVFFEGEGDVSS